MKHDIIDKQRVMLTTGKDVHNAIQSNETVSASFIKLSSNLTKCINLTANTHTASVTTSKVVVKSKPTSRLHGQVSKTSSTSAYPVIKSQRTASGKLKAVGKVETRPTPVCLNHIPSPLVCPGCNRKKCNNMVVLNGAWYNGRSFYLGDRIYNKPDDIRGNQNRINRLQQMYSTLARQPNYTTTCFILFYKRYFPLVLKPPPLCQPSSTSSDDDADDANNNNSSDELLFYGRRNK